MFSLGFLMSGYNLFLDITSILNASHWIFPQLDLVVIGTDCTASCKSNYRTIPTTATTAPVSYDILNPMVN